MSPFRQDALGLALIACSLGVLVCRAAAAFERRDGIYRRPAKFASNIKFWNRLAWAFGISAVSIAGVWVTLSLAGG